MHLNRISYFILSTLLMIGMSLIPYESWAKAKEKRKSGDSYVKIELDNDVILKTDYYYSQGLTLAVSTPLFEKNPINRILLNGGKADLTYYSLALSQEIYTPKNIRDSLINITDRPYAGTLYLSNEKTSLFTQKKMIWHSSLYLGLIGPLSGAGKIQKYFHDLTGSTHPQGWDYQIRNMPVINYNLKVEKSFLHIPGFFELNGLGEVRVGTMYDDISLGTSLVVGNLSQDYGLTHLSAGTDSQNNFQIFIQAMFRSRWAFYNATLQGGLLVPQSPHKLEPQDIKRFILEGETGITLKYKFLNLSYFTFLQSPDFHGGDYHIYNRFILHIRF